MRVHEAEAILKYYADIPQRIEIIRRQCAALNDEIDPMRGMGTDGMPHGGAPGDSTAAMACRMEELGIGELTLVVIINELEKPGRDPRDEMPKPILRSDVLEMKDLKPGMILKGTVRNVIDFGVFVDIGVHQDGLVHISQLTDKKFIKHPLEVVSVGDVVEVRVMSVDLEKKRIQLTMKL